MDKNKKRHYRIRANKRAGRPNYSLDNRFYPEYMPATTKGHSQPLVGLWHMRRVLRFRLGYIAINGQRSDEWTTYSPDKIAYFHSLIEWADKKLKEGEKKFYDRLKVKDQKDYEQLRKGILSDIYDQTDDFIQKRKALSEPKQCLNEEKFDMAKMSFEQMMDWAKNVKDFDSGFNFLKFTQGVHCVRLLSGEEDNYFLSYSQHDTGQKKDFRSWLCWDWIMDNKEVREYFAEKELLTEEDAKKAKKYGDPVCNTLEAIKKYVKNMEPIYSSLRTKTRCLFNVFYIYQAYPDVPNDSRISPGNYVLEQSAGFNKKIISAINKDMATDMDGEEDALSLLSTDNGKMLAIQVEGEGIGKNKREYGIDFKGKRGPIYYCEDGTNPYVKGKSRLTLPDDFQIYNLMDVMAIRFLPYQEVINQIKNIPTIGKVITQIGYEIPGDEPSDNPLDENYDSNFAKRTVGKPIAKPAIKEESWTKKVNGKSEKKENWEDEEVINKEKKQVQSKKVVEVEEDDEATPRTIKNLIHKVKEWGGDEDNDIPFDTDEFTDEDEFTKAVPKSDPKKEVITNTPKKRKVF